MVNCKHRDCFYIQGNSGKFTNCGYSLVTGQLRGCPAGDCDKYISCREARELGLGKIQAPPQPQPKETAKKSKGRTCKLPGNFGEVFESYEAGEYKNYREAAAANALQQHGVRVVVLCKFCKHFEGLRKEGWCNLHNCIRKVDAYCSYGERRK